MEDDDAAVRACALNELKFLNNILERHGKRRRKKVIPVPDYSLAPLPLIEKNRKF